MKSGFDMIPSNIMLTGVEQELSQIGKEHRVKETIMPMLDRYDFIIIGTPPSLGMLTVNAFSFAIDILILTTVGIFVTIGRR